MDARFNTLGGLIVKKYGVNELREMFLSFFEEKGRAWLR